MAQRVKSSDLMEEVLTIRMHTKVTKGGRNLTFAALVAVGDGHGKIGLGHGRATGVPQAIEKANKRARESMFSVPLIGDTLCHEQIGYHKASKVLLKPAAPGTGVKAGATIRAMLQVLGVHNVLTKSLGRNNPINLSQAAVDALKKMRLPDDVEALRGREIIIKHPQWNADHSEGAETEIDQSESVLQIDGNEEAAAEQDKVKQDASVEEGKSKQDAAVEEDKTEQTSEINPAETESES